MWATKKLIHKQLNLLKIIYYFYIFYYININFLYKIINLKHAIFIYIMITFSIIGIYVNYYKEIYKYTG